MSPQYQPTSSSFDDSNSKHSKSETKQDQQQQQSKTTLPTSPSSLNQSLKPPMFTFEGDELLKEGGELATAAAAVEEEAEEEEGDHPYQYDVEPPAIFERSVQDCCSPHRTNSIISLTNTLNNYTPSSSSASNNNNNNSVNANSSTTSITNLTNSFHSTASGSRRKSFIKRPRSSTTNSFNNRLEDSFTPLNSLITSFDSNNNNDAATTLPLSPNSPPKLKHTQSQLNCCSYAELICDESWSTHSHGGSFSGAGGASGLGGARRFQQPPIRSTQSSGVVPTLRSPKWKK